jgi:lipoprotein NlpD
VVWASLTVLSAVLVVGCAAPKQPPQRAPVVDRTPVPAPAASAPAAPRPLPPGAENAGRPGYYTVRPGDTLIRIGLETGQNWRDLQAWNSLSNPNLIEVGQVLRVVPPVGAEPSVAASPPAAPVSTQPVPSAAPQPRPLSETGVAAAPAPARTPAPAPAPAVADELRLVWPASGPVLDPFDETRNRGVGIGGRAGDPVLAAADGRVVYAGSGLRGYGNLIILKHNNTYLTAYAHNQSLLVREDQSVRQGQKIAEMGSSDTDRVKLHFEVRRQGKPVDPLQHLPRR